MKKNFLNSINKFMKKIITVLLCVVFVSCNTIPKTIIQPIVIHDTIERKIAIDTSHRNRFFEISYETTLKSGKETDYGNLYMVNDIFPNKNWIDNGVYKLLDYKKSCYQNVVITSIYEFKDQWDYYSYLYGYKLEKENKNKKPCTH